jgi:hypothetical protein
MAAVGLAIGGALGMAGSFVTDARLRQALWAIDGVALVVAAALLCLKFARRGEDSVAAGFLVFLVGESMLLAGTAAGLEGGVASYGGGVALWSAALVLTSAPKVFPTWVRVTGVAAAVPFAITAGEIFWGERLLAISRSRSRRSATRSSSSLSWVGSGRSSEHATKARARRCRSSSYLQSVVDQSRATRRRRTAPCSALAVTIPMRRRAARERERCRSRFSSMRIRG